MQPLQLSPRYSEALPMYYRLQQTLIDKIICQDWKAGMQLPSEREIAATMGISVGTVRKALENMVHKGYLSRIQGKGTFVAENTLDRNNVKYYRLRKSLTDQDTSLRVRTISIAKASRTDPVISDFSPAPDIQEFLKVSRVFLGKDGETFCPVVMSESYIPLPFGEGLMNISPAEMEELSLYLLIEKYCHFPVLRSCEQLGVECASRDVAHYLEEKEGTPMIRSNMLSMTYEDRIVEFRRSLIRPCPFGLMRFHVFRK